MADTPVLFQAPSGLSNVKLELYPRTSDSIANGAGGDDGTEESSAKTWYRATVSHGISGWYRTTITVDGTSIGGSWVYMEDDTDIHFCEEAPERLYDGGDALRAADVNTQVLDVINVDTLVAGVTIPESLRRIGALTSGIVTGAGTGTETFKDYAESASTIVITVDASGNRSAITYN